MKRIICVAASILLATSAFAQRVELKVWESSGPEKEYVMWAARNYRKVNKNVRIVYEPVEATDARAKIELDGPAGVGADIFVTPHDHIGALVAGGHVLPVSNPNYINDFIDSAKTAEIGRAHV